MKRSGPVSGELKRNTRGRPRAFDCERALDQALKVFWRKGYEGASLPDLTRAMGINRPSLYAAFGNKQSLFSKAIERYEAGPASFVRAALEAPTARAAVEQVFRGTLELLTNPKNPGGCLMVHGALACGADADPVRKALIAHRAAGQELLRRRFARAKSDGDLPRDANPADLARYVSAVVYGMCVQAASGAGRAELGRLIKTALRAWPE